MNEEVSAVTHAAIGESFLPDGKFGFEAMGETTFDELDGSFKRDVLRSDEQMGMARHDYEGVKFEMAFAAIVLEGFEEEFCVRCLLEETAAIPGLSADEECSVACCSGGDGHGF